MSYITDAYREDAARARGETTDPIVVPGQMFEEVLEARAAQRRGMLKGTLGAGLAATLAPVLSACGGSSDSATAIQAAPGASNGAAAADKAELKCPRIERRMGDQVFVPANHRVSVLYCAGDACEQGSTAYAGSLMPASMTEKMAGGNHDGMHFFEKADRDRNQGGLLAINHEAPDPAVLFPEGFKYDGKTATADQKRIALSSVGVSIIEVAADGQGNWSVVKDSHFNRRYTGNTTYDVSGPAASIVGPTVVGTLNNCSSGSTPWGTYLTCEETTDNYLDPTQKEQGYGWIVEIDPYSQGGRATKRTAMGRFDHENVACMTNKDNRVAFYMGDDGTPGCIYKFVPNGRIDYANRAANAKMLDEGTLYAAKFNADGSGEWVALVQGQNGLMPGALDPGNETQGPAADKVVDFRTQADVLINTKAAARVAGATLMDRPEWITVAPDGDIYVTLTNNGGRKVTDKANPRPENKHGHIVHWREEGDSPLATKFRWDILLLAGDPREKTDNLKGNIVGDTFSSPDGIRVDPIGRLWVETDMSINKTMTDLFGNNAMYLVDRKGEHESRRFLVGPDDCEITGIAYTPDLKTMFINIQHPNDKVGAWPSNQAGQNRSLPGRSATIVIQHREGKRVGEE